MMGVPGWETPGLDISKGNYRNHIAGFAVNHFFDSKLILKALVDAERKPLLQAGALIRTIAVRSIRPPRRMSLGEMSPRAVLLYKNRAKRARKEGKPRPLRPYKPADPGTPPRSKWGYLKKTLFFGYDVSARSSVVGPIDAFSGTAWLLEHGGTGYLKQSRGGGKVRMNFKGNPFMEPALKKAEPKIPRMFQNML